MDKVKLRTFIITYLHFKKSATAKQLAETYNILGFENLGISKNEIARFLKKEKYGNSPLSKIETERGKNQTIYKLFL